MHGPLRRWTSALVFAALLGALTASHLERLDTVTGRRVEGDSAQMLAMAYNLLHAGVLSTDTPRDGETPEPSAYRPPGYPVFLAAVMAWTPALREARWGELARAHYRRLRPVFRIQHLLVLLVAYVVCFLVWRETHSPWLALLPLPLIVYTPVPFLTDNALAEYYAMQLLAETLATALLALGTLFLVLAVERRGAVWFAACGAALACLALTRASFVYLGVPLAAAFAGAAWRRPAERRRWLVGAALFAGLFHALVGAWMLRNHENFGRWFVAERGGAVLNIRAEYDEMTGVEYAASFLYFSSQPALRRALERGFPEAAYRRLDRSNPESFYRRGRARRDVLQAVHGDSVRADALLADEAIRRIAARPVDHLLVTLPLGFRGICVNRHLALNLFWSLSGLAALGFAVRRRDAGLLALLAPALYSLGFNALFTHNIPRYTAPSLPLVWAGVVVFYARLLRRTKS